MAMKEWYKTHPALFNKRPYNHTGRDICRIPDDHISKKRYPWFIARDVMQRAIEQFIQQAQGDQPT